MDMERSRLNPSIRGAKVHGGPAGIGVICQSDSIRYNIRSGGKIIHSANAIPHEMAGRAFADQEQQTPDRTMLQGWRKRIVKFLGGSSVILMAFTLSHGIEC